jgi:hypothetical protein
MGQRIPLISGIAPPYGIRGAKRTTLIARMKKLGIDARPVLDANRYGDLGGLEQCVQPGGD